MKDLRPFFYFFGAKFRSAPYYPKPEHLTVIEPFAGSAGYSVRHHERNVVLVDKDPVVADLWRYLIEVRSNEIRSIPVRVEHVDDLKGFPQETKHLVGFWLNKATTSPRKTPSAWVRSGIRPNSSWGEAIRERIASQVERIRHWRAIHGTYNLSPDIEASWFIDPPYEDQRLYKHRIPSYSALARYCRSRRGLTIVCEREGANWLPFRTLGTFKATSGRRGAGMVREVVWIRRKGKNS